MLDDPIVTDGSAEDPAAADTTQQAKAPDLRERDQRLAEIAREAEAAAGIKGSEYEEAVVDEDDAEQVSDQGAAAPDPLKDLGYYQKDDGKLYTKMKINGVEHEVAADQIKAYIQKDLAGDHKLQQAAERERRLQEQEQLLRQREAQIQQSLSQRPSAMDADEAKKQAKAVLEQLWGGDTEAATEALVGMMQRGNATVDPNQILLAAEQRALTAIEQREIQKQQQSWHQSVDEGNRFLMEQHPEIYQDQRLFDLVNGETARMVEAQQAGDPELATLTPKDIIARAAQEVQGWMTGRTQPPQKQDGNREQRKAGLKPIPRGMNATRQPKPEQTVDTSPSAVISRMRASRAVV